MYRSLLLFSILILTFVATGSFSKAEENPHVLIDINSGEILSSHKADNKWYPASLTKLMTAYVTFRAIHNEELEDGSPVFISHAATRQPPSRMGYKKGVRLRVDTALKIIIIKSANDVSHALGEAVAGSVPNFVARMNAEAKRLGMINTRFANTNGLHNKNQFSSARDMAILTAQIKREFPQYNYMYEAVAIKTPVKTHYSYNLLLERYPGTTGMKTGFVCASGYNMVATAQRNGRHLAAVVLGRSSQTDRAVSAAKLLNAGFDGTVSSKGNLFGGNTKAGPSPVNMRPILCTEKARANRYDPGAGQAKIKSDHLNPRKVSNNIINVRHGGVDAPAGDAYLNSKLAVKSKVPIPSPSPIKAAR